MSETTEQPKPPSSNRRRIKKVKGHGGGHHGGSWKVAYADLVTALMALFLVLWLVSQADTKVKESIAQYFRAPGVFSATSGGILTSSKKPNKSPDAATLKEEEKAFLDAAQTLRRKFETRPEFSKLKDQVKIQVTDEGLNINVIDKADQVSFASGNADLTETARLVLAEIARGICELPNFISIGGHTDRHVYAADSAYTNWELSADRANAARRSLEANCVRSGQIRRVVGFADTEPLVPEDPFAPANRRISITVLRTSNAEAASAKGDDESRLPAKKFETPETKAVNKASDEATHNLADETKAETIKNPLPKSDAATHAASPVSKTNQSSLIGEPDKLPEGIKVQKIK